MNVRAMPVMLSLIFSLAVLFGGWFSFQQFYVQKPIEEFVANKPGVKLSKLQINKNHVLVELDFQNPERFIKDYKEISDFIYNKTEGKKVEIQLPKSGESMKELWDEEFFSLAEALEKKEYSHIPKIMDELGKKRHLDKTMARMDDRNIYVYLQSGSDHLYAVLPLREEVKTDE